MYKVKAGYFWCWSETRSSSALKPSAWPSLNYYLVLQSLNILYFLRTNFKILTMSVKTHHAGCSVNIFSMNSWIFADIHCVLCSPKNSQKSFLLFFSDRKTFFHNTLGKSFSQFKHVSSLTSSMKLALSLFLSILWKVWCYHSLFFIISQCTFSATVTAYTTCYLFYDYCIQVCITCVIDVRYLPVSPIL